MKHVKEAVSRYLSDKLTVIGFAPVDRFDDAPEKHHPKNVCHNAKTVIVYGIPVSNGVFSSPDYNLHLLHRSYHTVYRLLDEISFNLCNHIETMGPYVAVAIPSYSPLVFHGMEPWGILSLKHAAVKAGLGAFGKTGLVYHPEFGSLLRLGGVVTSADIPGDAMRDKSPCPPKCKECSTHCPPNAIKETGAFSKMTCLGHTIKHAIYPLALKDEQGLKHIERVINTAGNDYWLACDECLKVCPINLKIFKNKSGENP
jgi:epoxyqueuosine reductase